jgi:hypothetical protein
LTTAFRDQSASAFSGAKNHYLACHVDFTDEERAIIQERGLYDFHITVPSDTPLPTRGGDFSSMLMRGAGIVLMPLGLLIACAAAMSPAGAGGGIPGALMLIAGIALFAFGKSKDIQANRRDTNPDQTLTFRRLLANPDFVVHAYSLQEAQMFEGGVRETLSGAARYIRENAVAPGQKTYDL